MSILNHGTTRLAAQWHVLSCCCRPLTTWKCSARQHYSTLTTDIAVVGAGHNGLVAAALLVEQGYKVDVFEAAKVVGGACRTEYPFPRAPGLGQSTGAYLLGVMPPELLQKLNIRLPLLRRDPHYFLPTAGSRYLLFGSDSDAMQEQFLRFFTQDDWNANRRMQTELSAIRDDIAPAMLAQPTSVEEAAERYVRPALKQVFVDLVQKPVMHYLDRFGFRSDLLRAMYAVTDGVVGIAGDWNSPGSGMNFLAHNMCRLPGSDGTWMVAAGGMGTVTAALARRALELGAVIHTASPVGSIPVKNGHTSGIVLQDGCEVKSKAVLVAADPFRLRELTGRAAFDTTFNAFMDGMLRDGRSCKLNMALRALPTFTCLPEAVGQHRTTIHLLPEEDTLNTLTQAHAQAEKGHLPTCPAIEWYIHTTVDPSLQDREGRHSSALFVQWVPYELQDGKSWETEEESFVQHLLRILDRYAPGTSDLVDDTFMLTPPKIESHFGISRGHIHHVDNSFAFDQRFPYATPVQGLYSCSAGCHPAGSVMGAAGHNAAMQLDRDLRA